MTDSARPGPQPRLHLPTLAPSVRTFLSTEAGGAVLLLVATVVALVWANLAPGTYAHLWSTTAGVHVGGARLELDLHQWVNDAAMAVFFLVVGLEISREATVGDLRDPRTIAVPALGALGGLTVPALIYLLVNHGGAAAHGWGVVMSTDTAFLVGVLALFGPRCPDQLRLFLLTLAIVDDIGAITVMAVFYTPHVAWLPLGAAVVLTLAIVALRWLRIWRLGPYTVVGVLLWLAVHASGVHATLAGVLVGLLLPARPPARVHADSVPAWARRLQERTTADRAHLTELAARATVPAGDRAQRLLHPWSAYVVVPLFGLANAGIRLDGQALSAALHSRITLGIVLALVLGNAIGIVGASTLALRGHLGELPGRVRYGHLLGGAILAGIGFTISLFVAELAFTDVVLREQAKVGILAGSLIAAVLGTALLRIFGERLPLCSPAGLPDALPPRPWLAPVI